MPPVNLADVSIPLQQFQAISSGKYNAGEVRLTGEHTIGEVNNHVHGTGKNRVALSHAEIVAVKQAFVRTLSGNGVGALELERIRQELGLAALEPKDTSLKDRIIRPLLRQQVRDILDRNADAINATMGQGTIRTSGQIYAGVSERKRERRAGTRDMTNAALAATPRRIERHDGLDSFQRIVADDIAPGMPREDRRAMASQANEVLARLLHGCDGKPRAGCPAMAEWTDPATGAKFSLDAGCDEVAFARKLEDEIVRLQRYECKDVLANADWNEEIKDSLEDFSKEYKLLPGFRQMAMDAMAEAQSVFGVLLDPQGCNALVAFNGEFEERAFTMELDDDGGLNVRFRSLQRPRRMMVNGDLVPCGEGSSVVANLDLHVDAGELARISDVDFATYDDAPRRSSAGRNSPSRNPSACAWTQDPSSSPT